MASIYINATTDRQYRAATGLKKEQFDILLEVFTKAKFLIKEERDKRRLIKRKETHSEKLPSDAEELFFILYYLKNYPTFDILALIYGMKISFAHKKVQSLLVSLLLSLEMCEVLPKRDFENAEEFAKALKGKMDVFVDATERRIERPENQDIQKKYYSGKKKPTW